MNTKTLLLQDKYSNEVSSQLQSDLDVKNMFEVPHIEKVVVNVGVGKMHKEEQQVQEVMDMVAEITGQRPLKSLARKAISGFKVRQGAVVGVTVTLRKERMWSFLNKLVHIALPRTRDFQGLAEKQIDQNGNLNIGIKEHIVFPEIKPEAVRQIMGLQITIKTTAKNHDEGLALFKKLGFPFEQSNI